MDELTDDITIDPAPEPVSRVLGDVRTLTDPDRTQKRVRLISGAGDWAYYIDHDYHDTPTPTVVLADTLFNPNAHHFAGRFDAFQWTFDENDAPRYPVDVWITASGYAPPPPERRVYVEDEDAGLPRMERR